MSVPSFASRWTTSFGLPFGGSFTSSTLTFILVSVCGSYLGGFVSVVFLACKSIRHRDTRNTARKGIRQESDGADLIASLMAPPCPRERQEQCGQILVPVFLSPR